MDGGVLMNQAIHAIDLLCWLLGPVDSVAGATATQVRQSRRRTLPFASLRFASGALGAITATTAIAPGMPAELNLFCEQGLVAFHDATSSMGRSGSLETPELDDLPGSGSTDPAAIGRSGSSPPVAGHPRLPIGVDRDPLVTGEDGLATVAVIVAILESSRTGRAVRPGIVKSVRAGA